VLGHDDDDARIACNGGLAPGEDYVCLRGCVSTLVAVVVGSVSVVASGALPARRMLCYQGVVGTPGRFIRGPAKSWTFNSAWQCCFDR
jgi:hypothetical protein